MKVKKVSSFCLSCDYSAPVKSVVLVLPDEASQTQRVLADNSKQIAEFKKRSEEFITILDMYMLAIITKLPVQTAYSAMIFSCSRSRTAGRQAGTGRHSL